MDSKSLGKTGETISEIRPGTSRSRDGVEPLRRGVSLGAFIDTAEMYGTEDIVGEAVLVIGVSNFSPVELAEAMEAMTKNEIVSTWRA